MTELRVRKINGKKVQIARLKKKYSYDKGELLEGIAIAETEIVKTLRNNKLIRKEHTNLLLETEEEIITISWRKLKLCTLLEVDGKEV